MIFLIVDDEPTALNNLENEVHSLYPDALIHSFTSPDKAACWIEDNYVDIALLDISMQKIDGITLAKILDANCPECAVIFITGYSEYAVEAFKVHASGYLVKPVESSELQREIDYVRKQIPPHRHRRVRIQCFGNFEVFLDGKIMTFPRKKSKEILAYLVDRRGAGVSMAELASILWEDGVYDKSRNRQIHVFLHDLTQAFSSAGMGEMILRQHNNIAVDCSFIQCDYYDFLAGNEKAIGAYYGEYMTQYSWAEVTNGSLQLSKKPS